MCVYIYSVQVDFSVIYMWQLMCGNDAEIDLVCMCNCMYAILYVQFYMCNSMCAIDV